MYYTMHVISKDVIHLEILWILNISIIIRNSGVFKR